MKSVSNKIRKLFKASVKHYGLFIKLGLSNYFKNLFAKDGKLFSISIRNHQIWLRKGTPDIRVAICCLVDGEFDAISNYLDKSFKGVIVDAGGYIGTAAIALSEMFPDAQVISVEPSQANLEVLKKNISNNKRISYVYGALVGNDVGSVSLKNRGTGEWGFTVVENPRDNLNASTLHDTPAFTLSQLGVNLPDIGILKLDIEGGELDVFTNDLNSLSEIKVVCVELHDRIIAGCSQAFNVFSQNRDVFMDGGEKYFSIRRT